MKDLDLLPRLYIRGQIAPKDSFMLMMGGESFSASDVVDFLNNNKDTPEFVVEISSDGGYRGEGVEIYNQLKNSGKIIHTVTYKANSIATVIMLGNAGGGQRLIVEHSQFVVHFARIDPINLGMESLTSDDFQRLADETERADRQILDIYCNELGEDKRSELIANMADEKDLGAKGAIRLGFATGYYKKKKKISTEDFQGVLITDHLAKLIENKMATEKTAAQKFEDRITNVLSRIWGKVKNEVTLTLDSGKQIYVVPVDSAKPEDLMGGKAYEVDETGLPTDVSVADGDYVLDDGKKITVVAGIITVVVDAVDTKAVEEANKLLTVENTRLAAEITALKNDHKTELDKLKVEMKKEFDGIQMAFSEFKKAVPGQKKDDKKEEINIDFTKMSTAQRVRAMSKQRQAEEKERITNLNQ